MPVALPRLLPKYGTDFPPTDHCRDRRGIVGATAIGHLHLLDNRPDFPIVLNLVAMESALNRPQG
jgi:hypothetical protein